MTKGITASQEGIGIDRALDSQKVLDSRWKYFEIIEEKKVTLGVVGAGGLGNGLHIVHTHRLGFLPAFDCYNITLNKYMGGGAGDFRSGIFSSRTDILFQDNFPSIDYSNTEVIIRIYNIPITEEYSAPVEKTFPSKTSTPSKTGIKVLQKSRNFRDTELTHYSMNTASKALSIQKTGTVLANSGTNNQAVVRHDIGYPPTYLAAGTDPGLTYIAAIDPSFVPVLAKADGVNLTFRGAQAVLTGTWAYIIFKELADFAI